MAFNHRSRVSLDMVNHNLSNISTFDDSPSSEKPVDIQFSHAQQHKQSKPNNKSTLHDPKNTSSNQTEPRLFFTAQRPQIHIYDSSLGSMSSSSQENENIQFDRSFPKQESYFTVIINLSRETGPLGIHVLPDTNTGTNTILDKGLLIHAIEPNGRIDRDGRLSVGDTIVEVDDFPFAGIDFETAQDKFRSALRNEELRLKLLKRFDHADDGRNIDKEVLVQRDVNRIEDNKFQESSVYKMTSSKSSTQLKPTSALVVANTRRIGKKYHVQLKKGEFGLGFTITTRDNPAGGQNPIYIKTILPRGAAIQDGRLKPGDRILEVCGIEVTGKSQEETVALLRSLPQDSIVDIIVSRQEIEVSPSPHMPRQLPPEKVDEPSCSSLNEREVLTFQIPLNDTGSAGLGVSVKGKTLNVDGKQIDLGIHIKSVFAGGAACKDGKLKPDDQLININSISLSRMTNSEAMATLRRAMIHSEDSSITLTIARRVCRSPGNMDNNIADQTQPSGEITESTFSQSNEDSNDNELTSPCSGQDHTLDESVRSENTVIYIPYNKTSQHNGDDVDNPHSLNDSQLSLNDHSKDSEQFQRDGFGRQSMSEKRHAQLDARNTDTYRRSKKAKENSIEREMTLDADKEVIVTHETAPLNSSVYIRDDFSPPSHQINPRYFTTQTNVTEEGALQRNSRILFDNHNEPTLLIQKTPQPSNKHQTIFSPCCWNCQSPSTCMCSKTDLNPFSQSQNGLYGQTQAGVSENKLNAFVMRRSCSLESLQMMMQDLQKEQLGQVGGTNGVKIAEAPNTAIKAPRALRETNESFRYAVDRSLDARGYPIETSEETNKNSPSTCPNRVRGGHSMTSTEVTTTADTEDNGTRFKAKKKKSLFRHLFNFGSGKKRSKSTSSSKRSDKSYDLNNPPPDANQEDANLNYCIEQERLRMYYHKMVEDSRKGPTATATTHFTSNNANKSLHQSMPVSIAQQNKRNLIAKIEQQKTPTNYPPGLPITGPQYGTSLIHRNAIGVPHKNTAMRHNHKIHPEVIDRTEAVSFVKNPQYDRGQDYRHSQMERYGNRINMNDKSNYATYGVLPNQANDHVEPVSRPYYTVSRVNNMAAYHAPAASHYRQLSLRNAALQHQRQISSPAMVNNNYRPQPTTSDDYAFNANAGHYRPTNNVRDYSIYGQTQASQHQQHMMNVGQLMQDRMRIHCSQPPPRQHPIYESSQVQIYGYNAPHHRPAPSSTTLKHSSHYGNFTACGDEII